MRIVTLTYAGNEEDIIESFVRHHARFAETMFVVCTGDDRTYDIVRNMKEEGLPLDVRLHRTAFHDQSDVLTALLDEARAVQPDWVLPLDADEFVQCEDLPGTLAGLPHDAVTLIPWRTYVPTIHDAEHADVLRRITNRRSVEKPQFYKIMIPSELLSECPIIGAGNHELQRRDSGGAYPARATDHISLAHFPVRSEPQIRRKVELGWERTIAKPNRGANESFHWKDIVDLFASGNFDLTTAALAYAGSDLAGNAITTDPVRTPMTGTDRMR